jgi:DNA-binding response OmpR family regulator
VLVVDDEPDVRSSVADILRDAGYDVEEASDGDEALDVLSRRRVDAMLLDLVMPRRDGMGVMEALSDPPPVLVISAHRLDAPARSELAHKVVDFLEKPVRPKELLARVAELVDRGGRS